MERLQIIKLSCGGVAEAAGLMVGDWLDEYNGVLLVSSESLSAAIKKSSGTHTMKVVRNLQRLEFPIKAGSLGISVEPGKMVDIDNEAAEKSLMHTTGTQTTLAYQRSDLLDRRRVVMQLWADALFDDEKTKYIKLICCKTTTFY